MVPPTRRHPQPPLALHPFRDRLLRASTSRASSSWPKARQLTCRMAAWSALVSGRMLRFLPPPRSGLSGYRFQALAHSRQVGEVR
jgi:hypothetical protein